MQGDGNLVEYVGSQPLWASDTAGHPGAYLGMQGDGNLVLYGDNGALWSSDTAGHPGAWLGMQGTDGNLVIYGPGGQPLWSSATAGNAGARLAVQTDGNVVIYTTANTATWSTGTSGGGGALPLGTPAENAVIAWARPYADAHNVTYNGLCLTFVFNAYSAAGIDLRNWVTVPIGANTYPADIWGHFSHGTTGGGTPPPGALVFWNWSSPGFDDT